MNVYDFDHTIYDGDASIDFFKFCLRERLTLLRFFPKQMLGRINEKIGRYDTKKMKEYFFSFLTGIEFTEAVNSFWTKNQHKIGKWYLDQKKPDDIIITASPSFLIKPICDELSIRLVATEMDPLTGKIRGENCKGEEKLKRFRQEFENTEVENFYSDSLVDMPLAEISKKAFLVKKGSLYPWPNL